MKARLGTVLPLVLLFVAPAVAQAQIRDSLFVQKPGVSVSDNIPPSPEQMEPEEQAGTSGFFLGVVSMLGGAAIGSLSGATSCPPRSEDRGCVGDHAVVGALVAGSIMTPIGVHLTAHNHKSMLKSVGLSVLTGAALYFGFHAIPGQPTALAPFVAMPLQVYGSVKLAR